MDGPTLQSRSVLILGLPDGSGGEAENMAAEINPSLAQRDLIALVSDPSRPIVVDGSRTTQMGRVLILLQRLSHLKAMAATLERQGYYARWPKAALRRVGRE